MPPALEVLTGRVTAPGTTITALTPNTGNSWVVRSATPGSDIYLIQAWNKSNGAGTLRIRSPRLHDEVQGLRFDTRSGVAEPLMPWGFRQRLYPGETITVEMSGSSTSGHIELASLLIYYADLPGVSARLMAADEVLARIEHVFTVENTLALGTSGDYTGEETIISEFNLFKAGRDYALLGYLVDTLAGTIRWRGSETGNLGVGGPADPSLRHLTCDWFVRLSRMYGLPLIPVFNASNTPAILIDGVQDQGGADPTVTSIFAMLSP